MTLRKLADLIVQHDNTFACRIQTKKNQILVKCADWPDEVIILLSPYYQQRLTEGSFDQNDLEGIFAEIDRIRLYGM